VVKSNLEHATRRTPQRAHVGAVLDASAVLERRAPRNISLLVPTWAPCSDTSAAPDRSAQRVAFEALDEKTRLLVPACYPPEARVYAIHEGATGKKINKTGRSLPLSENAKSKSGDGAPAQGTRL